MQENQFTVAQHIHKSMIPIKAFFFNYTYMTCARQADWEQPKTKLDKQDLTGKKQTKN
jgi:hypothetical protein